MKNILTVATVSKEHSQRKYLKIPAILVMLANNIGSMTMTVD